MSEVAEASLQSNDPSIKEGKSLLNIFLEGWDLYEEVEHSTLSPNSAEFQEKLKEAISRFENATKTVSSAELFSANEIIDEVSTESLQYLLLPFFLGKLTLQLSSYDRDEILKVAEVYFKDYLKRCQEYEICQNTTVVKTSKENEGNGTDEMENLMRAAHTRNNKIAQFRRKKELEEQLKPLKYAVRNNTVDEEIRRKFFLNLLNKCVIEANEELESMPLEKQMAEMRKMRMSMGKDSHQHHKLHASNPKPLQPFIITRNDAQKAVFGLGYPSLPIMTVNEFYDSRVKEGIFPDEEKMAKMNQAQAIAAAQDPEEKEELEKAEIEMQIETENPEYLARMRRMDEYKDVVRRGDGNRHNRS